MRALPLEQTSARSLRVDLGGNGAGPEWVELDLRFSRRARRAGLRVRPGRSAEIVLPAGSKVDAAGRLLATHADWLRRKLTWAETIEDEARRLGLLTPGLFWLDGEPRPASDERAGEISSAAAERWYRDRARAVLGAATERAAADLAGRGLLRREPGRITIRDPRSRWGSCSARGNLSYSWRLVMMPRRVLEYVVGHELCHLEILDHSPRFWRLLTQARPAWQAEAAWLRRYGPAISLHRPGGAVAEGWDRLPADLPAVEP